MTHLLHRGCGARTRGPKIGRAHGHLGDFYIVAHLSHVHYT